MFNSAISLPVSQPLGWRQPYSGEPPTSINLVLKLPHRPVHVSIAILNPIKSVGKTDHRSYLRRETQSPLSNFPGPMGDYTDTPNKHPGLLSSKPLRSGPRASVVSVILHIPALSAAADTACPFHAHLQGGHSLNYLNMSWLLGSVPNAGLLG